MVALVSQGSVASLSYSRGDVPAIFIYVSGVNISSSVRPIGQSKQHISGGVINYSPQWEREKCPQTFYTVL